MNYEYKDPLKNGYTKLKVSKRIHNSKFPNIKLGLFDKVEYYISDNDVITHRFTNWIGIFLSVILFPLQGLISGFGDKDMYQDYKKLFNQKKYGSFRSNKIWKSRQPELYEYFRGFK